MATKDVVLNFQKKKKYQCIRKITNWSNAKQYHKFDNKNFDSKQTKLDIETCSPKLEKLLKNIQQLDIEDMKKSGKNYKHFIYSDVKFSNHGSKIIAAGLTSINKYSCWYSENNKTKFRIPKTQNNDTFALLCSSTIFGNKITVSQKKEMLSVFNNRPKNIYGKDIRFIILDNSFKEGIDLFDVKYVHIFEPEVSNSDLKQIIGRATRLCGNNGLKFIENKGWTLNVFLYTSNTQNYPIEKILSFYSEISLTDKILADQLDKLLINSAIDKDLNHKIHVDNPFSLLFSQKNKLLKKEIKQLTEIKQLLDIKTKSQTKSNLLKYLNEKKNRENYKSLQTRINKEFNKYKYDKIQIKNLCNVPQSSSRIAEFTPSQNFISNYFVPNNNLKGMLIYHSVGSGKTCTAIATKSKTWEQENYTILWVTRSSLKDDIWKNIFTKVCDYMIKEKINSGLNISETIDKKYISKNFLTPVSFAQFSNALKANFGSSKARSKNSLYSKLIQRNGTNDILNKTLIIIDEAHKLLATDLIGFEKPDFSAIKKGILQSYKKSGKDSCRLLLLTATPVTENPMNTIKLLNLLDEKQMPENTNDFIKQFSVNTKLKISKNSKKLFKELIKGKISYLNRSHDNRFFAIPIFKTIPSNISTNLPQETIEKYNNSKEKCKEKYQKMLLKYNYVDNIEKQANKISDLQNKLDSVDIEMKHNLENAIYGTKNKIKNKYTQRKKTIRNNMSIHKQTFRKLKNEWNKIYLEIEKNKKKCIKEIQKQHDTELKEKPQENALINKCKLSKDLL